MIELTELINKMKDIFSFESVDELGECLLKAIRENDVEKFDRFTNEIGLFDNDVLKKIFQYYISDRNDKKQDFTPDCLSELVFRLAGEDSCIDMCAGTGSLSTKFNNVTALEFDEKVIPFLLFNYLIRNISAEVFLMDVIKNEKYKLYKIESGDKYGHLSIESTVQC